MQKQLREVAEQAQTEIAACQTANDILNAKARYLGKKSLVNSLYGKLKDLPDDDKPAFGQSINALRGEIEANAFAFDRRYLFQVLAMGH